MLTVLFIIFVPYIVSLSTNSPVYTDSEFKPYLFQFKADARKYNVKLDLKKMITVFTDDLSDGVAAYCMPKNKLVVISRKTWETLDRFGKKALLYHEWGHCVLRRDHVEHYEFFPSFCPVSVMYPYIDPMRTCYKPNEESYIMELFTNPHNNKTFSRSRK